MREHPWALAAEEAAGALGVSPSSGLADAEAARRLAEDGPNLLDRRGGTAAWKILLRQLEGLTPWLLAAAALAAAAFGEWVETAAIGAVLAINTAIGFATELKAVRSIESLRNMIVTTARVRRGGRLANVPAEDLVPGDVVLLEAGDLVTADLRLLAASRLQVDESQLTGESLPVDKGAAPVAAGAPLAERASMLYKGTPVVRGSAEGVVTATGMRTELGRIAALTAGARAERTTLEVRLEKLGRTLAAVAVGVAALTTVAGLLSGQSLFLTLETGVALAVAAIPEGLPIVATLALARGVWRMARRRALVNRLPAIETLGAVTVVCTDKTGTLTENRMTLTHLAVEAGDFPPTSPAAAVRAALEAAVLCNNAALGAGGAGEASGDPLELALLAAGDAAGLDRAALVARFPRVREEAFDPATRRMATLHRAGPGDGGGFRVAVKGAPEAVLAACSRILDEGGETALGEGARGRWLARNLELAGSGLRLLGLAAGTATGPAGDPYADLTWLGLAVLEDPLRADARKAVAACRAAGLRVVMVTGDQEPTARAVAESAGLAAPGSAVVSGAELAAALAGPPAERRRLLETAVFARIDPEQKLDLVALHQEAGAVVAMTGDGVNDAPALRKADVGIAMGRRGSQVAREAAAMILEDDSLATLVEAVRQGRVIFGNIRRFVFYLLSCNAAEVMVVAAASLVALPLPVLPLQLLFLNLVTDVFPALALGLGEGDEGVMKKPPRDPAEPILTRRHGWALTGYAALMAGAVFGALAGATALGFTAERSVSVTFLTLAFSQLLHVFNLGSRRNPFLWASLALCTALLLLAVFVPPLARVFRLADPGPAGWGLVLALSAAPLAAGTLLRALRRGRRRALLATLALALLLPAGGRSGPAAAQASPPPADPVQLTLRARFPASGAPPRLALEGESFSASPDLACFYRNRGHAPAWSTAERLRPAAGELLQALADTAGDGLRPDDDYRLPALRRAVAAAGGARPDLEARADLDLLLSNAFLTAAAHLRDGKVNPEAVYADCALAHDAGDLAQGLEGALAAGGPGVRAALAGLAPPQPAYARLKEALRRYRRLAAGTVPPSGPSVPPGPTLRAGDRGERVAALRSRLTEAAAADAAPALPPAGDAALFDPGLEAALRHFQERHGLEPDGAAGKATLAELDLAPADHVRQIEVNLERWRWLPQDLGRRHLLINIAAFHLDAVEDGRTTLAMRVIVGKPFTRTPMFSSAVDGVVLNPSWYVPESIARKEIFPKAAKDPSYLARQNFEVLPGGKLRQRPGPSNALGRIKLVFPNRFGVYLHDTPAPALFGRTVRTFSHGCIRLEKPLDLAAWLLQGDPAWTPAALQAGIDAGRERTVPVAPKVPVHVAYCTAWVGDDGTLHLGRDVYGRDAGLARLLAAKKAGG